MDAVNTVIIGVLVSAASIILARMTKGQADSHDRALNGLRGEFADFRTEIRGEVAEFRKEVKAELQATEQRLDGRIDRLQAEVGGVRSDLTQVALAVGVKPRASNG